MHAAWSTCLQLLGTKLVTQMSPGLRNGAQDSRGCRRDGAVRRPAKLEGAAACNEASEASPLIAICAATKASNLRPLSKTSVAICLAETSYTEHALSDPGSWQDQCGERPNGWPSNIVLYLLEPPAWTAYLIATPDLSLTTLRPPSKHPQPG